MVSPAMDDVPPLPGDPGIVQEALERWHACLEWQGSSDNWTREDIKFANGDPRNSWQWPQTIYNQRTTNGNDLPCLTINNTRIHNDLIINALSKNGYGIKVRPTGGKASYKSAQVMQSIIRRVENISRASAQYRKVAEQQVDGGIGYILIETAYTSERSFDQDIYLKASRDPTAVYLDPWCKEPDGSDANFGFVFEKMPRKEFNRKYPKYKNQVGASPLQNAAGSMLVAWLSDKEIMLAKYFRKKAVPDTLVAYKSEDGSYKQMLSSEIKDDAGKVIHKALLADIKEGRIDGRTREVTNNQVEWFLVAGDSVVDRGTWAGKYIPICRCVGRELVIDGTLDRKGHTRPLIDANRMLNYNASTAVQVVALQPKAPWLAPARAAEGQEQWKTANIENYAVLFYNDYDEEAPEGAQKIDKPERINPPTGQTSYDLGMQSAERQMMMISGQYENTMGHADQQSAASGIAISERKEQGETATYHFVEHRSDMLRFLGVQLLDLIPKIYDTERALHIEDDEGEKQWIRINPTQQAAIEDLEHEKEDTEAVKLAFNPTIGEYECVSEPGPDFATQREEAWNALSMVLSRNKELAAAAGDLLFKYGDFPGADKIAERLEREIRSIKPYLFEDGMGPAMQQLQESNKKLTALNAELMQKLSESKLSMRGREEKRGVDAYDAETRRIVGLGNTVSNVGLDVLKPAVYQVISEMLNNPLTPEQHALQAIIDAQIHEREMGSDDGEQQAAGSA